MNPALLALLDRLCAAVRACDGATATAVIALIGDIDPGLADRLVANITAAGVR